MSPRSRAALLFAVTGTSMLSGVGADAQARRPPVTASASPSSGGGVALRARAHVGHEKVAYLLRSADIEERLRGIARAQALGTPAAHSLLVQAAESPDARDSDPRVRIELARALASFSSEETAQAALLLILNAGVLLVPPQVPQAEGFASGPTHADRTDDLARLARLEQIELSREIAAVALARCGVDRAFEQLYDAARARGFGQRAALHGVALGAPGAPLFFSGASPAIPAALVHILGRLGDLRALRVLHLAARSTDVTVQSAALVALAGIGDERVLALARASSSAPDARLRTAAGEVFVRLAAPEQFSAVLSLIKDEATQSSGIRLAERGQNTSITKLLITLASSPASRETREASIQALSHSTDTGAAVAIRTLVAEQTVGYAAALALARSPAPNALQEILTLARVKETAALGIRAYIVRALLRRERCDAGKALLTRLASSKDGAERALGVFGHVALGDLPVESALRDPDPRVRRAATMGALSRPSPTTREALQQQLVSERDEPTRQVVAASLLGGHAKSVATTAWLLERSAGGGPDAPLAAYALAQRADPRLARRVDELLASPDPVLRGHTARGLASSPLPDATSRLALAYAYETDIGVRRAIVAALSLRVTDSSSPTRRSLLQTAAFVDPDSVTRRTAQAALDETSSPLGSPLDQEVAWLRLTLENGDRPGSSYVASLIRADGFAVPIAFDDDGYAIVPGLPPGESRLVLAPRLPSYNSGVP